MGLMSKSEFVYRAIDLVFSIEVQGTIALENYKNATISAFNYGVLKEYNKFEKYYDDTDKMVRGLESEMAEAYNARLMVFLRKAREKNLDNILQYIDRKIISDRFKYDIYKKFVEYDESEGIQNPFERIIVDIREEEERLSKKVDYGKG